MYQLREAIVKRRAADHRRHAALVTAQTRHLHAAIFAAAGDETAGERAMKIDLVPRPKAVQQQKPVAHAPTVDAAIAAFGQPEWGVEPDGQ
jgi:hypothetical protein